MPIKLDIEVVAPDIEMVAGFGRSQGLAGRGFRGAGQL